MRVRACANERGGGITTSVEVRVCWREREMRYREAASGIGRRKTLDET